MNTPRARRKKRPDPAGVSSPENAPQVVVRAGKHYVCSACGTFVEIPADVVGQFVFATDEASTEEPETLAQPRRDAETLKPTTENSCSESSAAADVIAEPSEPSDTKRLPQREREAKRLRRSSLQVQTIDGLRVPSGKQLDRAFKWVAFDLTTLDRKQGEVSRLRKLLKKRRRQQAAAPATIHVHANRPVSGAKRSARQSGQARLSKKNSGERSTRNAETESTVAEPHSAKPGSSVQQSAAAETAAADLASLPMTACERSAPDLALGEGPGCRGREPP